MQIDPLQPPLRATMAWDLPLPSGSVLIQPWTEPNDAPGADFLQALAPYFGEDWLARFAALEPRFFVWDGAALNCTLPIPGGGGKLQCGSQCVNWGRYCAPDPDQDLERGLSGAQVLDEVVRSACVFQAANDSAHRSDPASPARAAGRASAQWISYSTGFTLQCTERRDLSAACSRSVQAAVGVSQEEVQACVSGSNRTDGSNAVLDLQLRER